MKQLVFILFISVLFFTSCEKTEEYPVVPEIKFLDFKVTEGIDDYSVYTGILKFSFVDGDGDIGHLTNDSSINIERKFDIFIYEYTKLNEQFSKTNTLRYYIDYQEEAVYRKYIKGEIEVKMQRTILDTDTARYEFYIIDRAGHESNIETTPVIIYSELLEQ